METFSALLALCAGNLSVTGEFPSRRPVVRSFDFFMYAWINGWVNNREAINLRRHRAHYDVTVMYSNYEMGQFMSKYVNPDMACCRHSRGRCNKIAEYFSDKYLIATMTSNRKTKSTRISSVENGVWGLNITLTDWGRISQKTFSKAFSWMKIYEFCLRFHWNLFPRFSSTIFQQWFR